MKRNRNTGTRSAWVEFLTSKGFKLRYEDDTCCTFVGCTPCIRIQLYDYPCRIDTRTAGCICADFDRLFNKPSTCPIYFSDNVKQEEFWKAIELLMEAGIEWSQRYGRIERGNGYLYCTPSIDRNKQGRKDKR